MIRSRALLVAFVLLTGGAACGQPPVAARPADVAPTPSEPKVATSEMATPSPLLVAAWKTCRATWYGQAYAGRRTASGAVFDPAELTVATVDRRIPFRAVLEVRSGSRRVLVRVTDRMGAPAPGRCLDLSRAAFERLAPAGVGILEVSWRRAS